MGAGRSKDLVAIGALLAACLLGGFLVLRGRGAFGARWSDGERSFRTTTGAGIRHAVWDGPEVLRGTQGEAADPTLSPDGRYLVFASGARGLNAELFVAELVDGVVREPRPMELGTPSDELAPAFGDGGLYFASDRPGGRGGLDVWRAPYGEGVFGPAEPLAPGINSPADELDPMPLGSGGLVFASDRARGPRTDGEFHPCDLYGAELDAAGVFEVEALDALNTAFDEREPALASDQRSLYFASDRAGSFGLFRAQRAGGRWSAPAPVPGLDSIPGARGPWVTADGFALLFDAPGADGERALFHARSRELFLVPPRAATLAEWLLCAALLALALLALLAKHWRALDILYKCFLVSLVLHLLLMLYLRTVSPEDTSLELGERAGRTFDVHLAPPEEAPAAPGELQARRGFHAPLSPARECFSPPTEPAAPGELSLAAPERPPEAAPARASLAPEPAPPGAGTLVALADREAPSARFSTPAPELFLAAPAGAPRATAEPTPAPELVRSPAAGLARALPARADLAGSALTRAEPGQEGVARSALERASAAPTGLALGTPDESSAPVFQAAPELALSSSPPDGAPRRPSSLSGEVERATLPTALGTAPLPSASAAREPLAHAAAASLHPPAIEPTRADPGAAATLDTALRASAAASAPAGTPEAPEFDAGAGGTAAATMPRPSRSSPAGPRRDPGKSDASLLASGVTAEVRPLRSAPHGAPDPGPEPAPARSSAPVSENGGAARGPSLRPPGERPGSAPLPTASAPAFDAASGLAVPAGARVASRALPPERARLGTPSVTALARPAAGSLALNAPPDASGDASDRAPAPRLSETPYQNRFGQQKLRALEEFGGSPETELAVQLGLRYLASIQEDAGAWGQRSDTHEKYLDVRVGKSGLALLAFLGAGHVPEGTSEHAAVVASALRFLLGEQDAGTGHIGQSCSYGHGIATYALAECYAMTRDTRLLPALQAALAEILRHQSRVDDPRFFGGFGYYFADGHAWNGDSWPRTSITAWQVMALESARLGGLAVPEGALDGAREFLRNAWDARARAFRYDHDPARLSSGYPILPASTPSALFALSLLGVDVSAGELAPARRFVLARAPAGYRFTGDDDFVHQARGNLYFWYYATLAMFRVGGAEWEHWNGALKETLLPAQDEDGSWRPLDTYSEYAGDEDDERTYSTSLCILSLEIYYRYFTPLLRVDPPR